MTVNDKLNMIVVSTEVILKWQQYGNNFTTVFPRFSAPVEDVFLIYLLTIQSQAVEVKVTFKGTLMQI